MDDNTACVLRIIIEHHPCTKLCVKQHSGLSMSTVLRAVDALEREGWITANAYNVPSGGKPHADLKPSARPVYGAVQTAEGWDVCALTLTGAVTRLRLASVEALSPLTVVAPAEGPRQAQIGSQAECVAAYLALREVGVYVDEGLLLYTASAKGIALGELPSPLITHKRLSYEEAFAQGTPQQKIRLKAELTCLIKTVLQVDKVFFADQVSVSPAVAAAWTAWGRLLHHL